VIIPIAVVITLKREKSGDFKMLLSGQVFHAAYVNPGFGESVGVNLLSVYQISDKTTQVIPFALLAILPEYREHSPGENVAGSSNKT